MFPTRFFLAFLLPAILASIITPVYDDAAILAKALRERDLITPGCELKAAVSTSHLAKKHICFVTASQVELTYMESKCTWIHLKSLS
jgi:hypothetical protein